MRIRVKVGHQGHLFEGETVWETVLNMPNVKNVLVEVTDEDDNLINTTQLHDPDEAVEEV